MGNKKGEKRSRLGSSRGQLLADHEGYQQFNHYHVYRILEVIAYKEYEGVYSRFYKRQNIYNRHNVSNTSAFAKKGCLCSATALKQMIGRPKGQDMHQDLLALQAVGLIVVEEHATISHWYTRLEVTDRGMSYLSVYEEMLGMLNYFEGMK